MGSGEASATAAMRFGSSDSSRLHFFKALAMGNGRHGRRKSGPLCSPPPHLSSIGVGELSIRQLPLPPLPFPGLAAAPPSVPLPRPSHRPSSRRVPARSVWSNWRPAMSLGSQRYPAKSVGSCRAVRKSSGRRAAEHLTCLILCDDASGCWWAERTNFNLKKLNAQLAPTLTPQANRGGQVAGTHGQAQLQAE